MKNLPPKGTTIYKLYKMIEAGWTNRDHMARELGISKDAVKANLYKLEGRKLIAHCGYERNEQNMRTNVYCLYEDRPEVFPSINTTDESDNLTNYLLPRKKTYFSNVSFIFHAGQQ